MSKEDLWQGERDAAHALPQSVVREIEAHHELYRRDPAAAHWWDPVVIGVPGGPVPCLVLHHRGRRSGRLLDSILQYYRRAGELAIVASKGGLASHPAWYTNLLQEPRCEVQIGTRRHAARAYGARCRACPVVGVHHAPATDAACLSSTHQPGDPGGDS